MVREYIIHDRGNSLFLSDSFGNLPSPVNESKTIKNLFKAKDDEDQKKHSKEFNRNKEIRIEGKSDNESEEDKEEKEMVDIDVRDIDRIVFGKEQVEVKRDSNVTYQEEESYVNPSNLSIDKYNCQY
mmetsp:Transcript_24287/g.18475  ORF Transcript_24287/g.18475 Transcript_24287/m.18475 type:complete len:127 (-) Transcript_24287:413-793(-)